MAGDWIKLEDLRRDPRIKAVARALKTDIYGAIGRVTSLWLDADQQAVKCGADDVDAKLRFVCEADLDEEYGAGFCEAMHSVGWMQVQPDYVVLPGFFAKNGDTAKQRALKNCRQSRWRHRVDGGVDAPVDAQSSTREEKRREEKTNPQTPASGGGGAVDSDDGNAGEELPQATTPTPVAKTHPQFSEVVREFGIATTLGPSNRAKLNAMLGAFGPELVRQGLTEARANGATNPIPYADTVCNRLHAEKFQGVRKPRAVASRPSPDRPVFHE